MDDDLITMDDMTNEEIVSLLDDAERLLPVAHGLEYLPLLQGKLLANMFFEPSTRTRMSFETAMKRLGGDVVNLGDVNSSSAVKGETLYDTMRMVDGYCDIAALRHPRQGAAQYAADACAIPIACEAIPILPPSNVLNAILKPSPSLPIKFFLGTFTLSK